MKSFSSRITLWLILSLVACQAHPDDLKYERNFFKGMQLGKTLNKPVFLHFTGYGVMGYDEFSEDFITDQSIQDLLNEHFITVLLYVDDKRQILEKDTMRLDNMEFLNGAKSQLEKAKTIGEINAALEIALFDQNIQPLYVIIDDQMNILIEPFGYTKKNAAFFKRTLQEGLKKYEMNTRK